VFDENFWGGLKERQDKTFTESARRIKYWPVLFYASKAETVGILCAKDEGFIEVVLVHHYSL
jgi:hypothetical protein